MEGFKRALGLRLVYASMDLYILISISLKGMQKFQHTILDDSLSRAVIYKLYSKDNTEKSE